MINDGKIKRILAAHHHPLDKEKAFDAIKTTETFLDDVKQAVIQEAKGIHFPILWKHVCERMNKQLEFRGYAMLEVQVNELIEDGILYSDNGRIIRK